MFTHQFVTAGLRSNTVLVHNLEPFCMDQNKEFFNNITLSENYPHMHIEIYYHVLIKFLNLQKQLNIYLWKVLKWNEQTA
jgi:hypothetical protein